MTVPHQPVGGDSCMPAYTYAGGNHENRIPKKAEIIPSFEGKWAYADFTDLLNHGLHGLDTD